MLSKNEIKYIQSLGHKKGRDEESAFIAEGTKIITEALNECPQQIIRLFAVISFFDETGITPNGQQYVEVTETELARISHLQTPQQAVAILRQFKPSAISEIGDEWALALDAIRDPGNMGTIIRLADWFGIQYIICSPDCADIYNLKVVQASMGSVLRVKLIEGDLQQLLPQCPAPVVAATLNGIPISNYSFAGKGTLLIGNEARGVADELLKITDAQISIPSFGAAESLNAAVATGIILWEIKRK
ncbi:MAG: RNA methyltransferase [Chitinophagaceae bacterium]|nr:RNA methyltransferase [Chitinophagaceae bacterium]